MERTLNDIVKEAEESADTKVCCECGREFSPVFVAPALVEDDLCSWRCWASLYGEEG